MRNFQFVVFCRRPFMKFGKWTRLAILVTMVLPCVVIVAVVSLMMIIAFDNLITHVDRLRVCNRLSAIAIDYYRCSTRPGRGIARCKNDDEKCNMKIIRLKSKLRLIF